MIFQILSKVKGICFELHRKKFDLRAVVVAQLIPQLSPIPEDLGSNAFISKF